MNYITREANINDTPQIAYIYNQGIEDRIATLEIRLRSNSDMEEWFLNRSLRHKVMVLEDEEKIVKGWASLNVFNSRCCYSGVTDMSIYIERESRGRGLGKILLKALMEAAKEQDFHKIVLTTFEHNKAGIGLYKSAGFREVGTYIDQGILDGKFVNTTIMEKLLA
jgi:L-amino acid N-acyltransferase YncA